MASLGVCLFDDVPVILELLKAADFYHEQELGSKCEQFLKLGVNAENICLVYEVATKHNAKVTKLSVGSGRRFEQ